MKHILLPLMLIALNVHAQTTYDIAVSDEGFEPDTLTVQVGDSVRVTFFALDHTLREVSQQTWESDSSTISGVEIGPPVILGESHTFALLAPDTFWYVCAFHVEISGEKGFIAVQPATGLSEIGAGVVPLLAPNPTGDVVTVSFPGKPRPVLFLVYDEEGKEVFAKRIDQGPVALRHLDQGSYVVLCKEMDGTVIAQERLSIVR